MQIIFAVAQRVKILPSVDVAIDLHGGIKMQQYIKTTVESLSTLYNSLGAEFIEEKLARKWSIITL
ncbi:MAG: hypothetical protein QXX95_04580 [Nitrososphaerales archaeon]